MKTEKPRPPSWDPALRREKYAADPKLRKRQQRRALARYRATRQTKLVRRTKTRVFPKTITVRVNGMRRDVLALHIGDLASVLGRSRKTITAWMTRGKLPAPLYRSESGWHLWTADQVTMLGETARECGINDPGITWADRRLRFERFWPLVRARWKAMPKGVAVEAA